MEEDFIDEVYVLVPWPDSRDYMEEDWFQNEAILASGSGIKCDVHNSYFIPFKKYLET
jgi:hypothetical protein